MKAASAAPGPSFARRLHPGMKLLAIVGSYRKGKTIDTLVDRAIEGARSAGTAVAVDKVVLRDKHIEFCRNCMTCRQDDPAKPYAKCVIQDDMQEIYPLVDAADAFLFGTPVNMASETAIMKAFLERLCWVMTRPCNFPLKGCPETRSTRRKKAIIIVSAGVVPPLLRRLCDTATPAIRDFCRTGLNARVVGTMYAGAVEKRGAAYYLDDAYRLGQRLSA